MALSQTKILKIRSSAYDIHLMAAIKFFVRKEKRVNNTLKVFPGSSTTNECSRALVLT